MTPKEKANELVVKMLHAMSTNPSMEHVYKDEAIRCALIAIDEIIDNEATYDYSINDYDYWLDVKKEIELL